MTTEERITNKEKQIGKLVTKFEKYSKLVSEEFLALVNQFLRTGDHSSIREYIKPISYLQEDEHNLYSTASDLYDARNTLEKYIKQLKAEQDKQSTLNNLPTVLIEFKNNLIKYWDEYDLFKKQSIKSEYKEAEKLPFNQYREAIANIRHKWGSGWQDYIYLSESDIHKSNIKDAEKLILNLINRVIETTGQITDCQYLHLSQDNNGYSIINGKIIGEKGTARIESIGAGGYNIQRYHIRVLVK